MTISEKGVLLTRDGFGNVILFPGCPGDSTAETYTGSGPTA